MAMKSLRVLLCSVLAVGLAAPVYVAHAQSRSEETASTATNFTGTATLTYTGKWHQTEVVRNWSGGTAATSIWGPAGSASPSDPNVPAAEVTLSFNGTGVNWIGARGPQTGIARVFVDGDPLGVEVDTYAPQEEIQAVVGTLSGLAPGPHTLRIRVAGTKNPSSTGFVIVVDAFDIEGAGGGRIQETGPAATLYYGNWIQGDDTRQPLTSGTFAYSYAEPTVGISPAVPPGQGVTTRAVFTFRGTRVTWIGSKQPQGGIANVYVDGRFVAEVDTFAPSEQHQVPLFTSAPLPTGIHTLAIEVTGTKSAASTCAPATAVPSCFGVVVDAFDVTP
jgi:hypothetical protein